MERERAKVVNISLVYNLVTLFPSSSLLIIPVVILVGLVRFDL